MSFRVRVHHYQIVDGLYTPFIETDQADEYRRVLLCAQPGSQEALLACRTKLVCLSGPRGPGKTLIALADYLKEIGQGYGTAWRGIILRRNMQGFDEMRSICNQYISQIFPTASFNQNNNRWVFATGETLIFRYFDEVMDYAIYQGASFSWICLEELTQWGDDKALRMMQATLRSTVPGIPLRMRATTNPDGPGHNWVKAMFGASDVYALGDYILGPLVPADDFGPERRMIYCRLHENQLLLNADQSYVAGIKAAAVDEGKYEGWVNGSWEILSGDMFGDIAIKAKQYFMLPSIPAQAFPLGTYFDRAFDWGDAAPFCVLWCAEMDGTPLVYNGCTYQFIRGDIVIFAEWYGEGPRIGQGLRLSTASVRDGIIMREIGIDPKAFAATAGLRFQDPQSGKWKCRVRPGPADTQIFNPKAGSADGAVGSIAEDFEEHTTINGHRFRGIEWKHADKSPGSRVLGWQAIRNRLEATIPDAVSGQRERPGLFVCENVKSFFTHTITLPRDPKGLEDIPKTGVQDHSADALRYRLTFSEQTSYPTSGRVVFGSSPRLMR